MKKPNVYIHVAFAAMLLRKGERDRQDYAVGEISRDTWRRRAADDARDLATIRELFAPEESSAIFAAIRPFRDRARRRKAPRRVVRRLAAR